MADTPTSLQDVIVPEIFNAAVVEETTRSDVLITSGIMTDMSAELRPQMGGFGVHMPYWNDLDGEDEVVSEKRDLTINRVTQGQDIATKLYRAKVFGATDLSGAFIAADPMQFIASRVAKYWQGRSAATLFALLKGVFGSASMAQNVLDLTMAGTVTGAAAVFDHEAFIDASHRLGDANGKLTAIAIHSDTEALMKKQDLIDYVIPSEGAAEIALYQGRRVLIDDALKPNVEGEYTSYLFGAGAVGFAQDNPKVPVEVGREALKGGGQEYLVNRRFFVNHIRGVKWIGTPADETASNAELATGTNWVRVYDPKNIRVVAFKHRLAAK